MGPTEGLGGSGAVGSVLLASFSCGAWTSEFLQMREKMVAGCLVYINGFEVGERRRERERGGKCQVGHIVREWGWVLS